MTNELVKRLRGLRVDGTPVDVTMGQAADEIERLTKERDEYKIWWERDSTALGKALNEVSSLRAGKEQFRAEIERLTRDMAALQSQWDDMQQGFVEVFGEPVQDAIELLGTVERIRSGNEPGVSASTYVGYPDGTCQMCGRTLGEHVCPTPGASRDASSTRVTVGCSQCTATVSLPQRDGLVDIDALGLWYFSTPTGWRCPAHAPAQRTFE